MANVDQEAWGKSFIKNKQNKQTWTHEGNMKFTQSQAAQLKQ